MAVFSSVGPRSVFPLGDLVLYENDRTRVYRVILPDGRAAIRKEALGTAAMARTRHECSIMKRLAGVAGVVLPMPDIPAEVHTITFPDSLGRSLAELPPAQVPQLGDLPRLALRLATILAAVHRAGVMHRDINPANILVGADSELLLIDFDLATTFAEVRPAFTHHRDIVGQLPYLAPEQTGRTGLPVDLRADLYGLGATLYELAVGSPPFGNGDTLQLVRDILVGVPRRLVDVAPGVSEGLSDVVARLLEKEPDRRYQSAEGLAYDLALVCAQPRAVVTLGERDFPSRLSAPSGLVGRDGEIDALRSALDRAMGTPARGVLVCGAPGVGKSALIEQLRPMVTTRGGWYVSGKFDQYRHDMASGAVIQALSGLARLLLAEPDDALATQRDRLTEVLGASAGLVTGVIPEFAALLGTDHPTVTGDPAVLDERLRQAGLSLLRAIASPQRPIVIVLDDLQWASHAALKVIDAIQTDEDLRGVLLVGAYRDAEADAAHPLTAMRARWDRLGVAPPLLALTNLAAADLATLLAEMLRLPANQAVGLAAAVGERTAGNPYDTVELVNALRGDAALILGEAGWSWDPLSIRRYVGRGDVVDLLTDRIERLPADARTLLEIMSCLGGEVGLDLLAAASGQTATAAQHQLAAPLEDALLVAGGHRPDAVTGSVVRFRHDRVQQAARGRLSGPTRARLHLSIARRLAAMSEFRAEAAEQYLAISDMLADVEAGADAGVDAAERRLAAQLFAMVAAGAARVSNHGTAERYLTAAGRLWAALGVAADDPALVGLETELHRALYSLGRLEEADKVYESITRRCRDPLELVEATCVQLSSLTNRRRSADTVALGFATLRRLGFAVPGADISTEVQRRLDDLDAWADGLSVVEDVARPQATDARALAAAELLRPLISATFFSDLTANAWVATEGQRLWARFGPRAALVPTITSACVGAVSLRDDYRNGVRIARHVLAVGAERGWDTVTAQARYVYAVSGCYWLEPLEICIQHARAAQEGCLHGGDLESACLSFYPAVFSLVDYGPTLDDLTSEVESAIALTLRTGNTGAGVIHAVYRQFARAMAGRTNEPGSFTEASFDEEAHAKISVRVAAHYAITRALSAAIFGDMDGLPQRAAAAMRYVPALKVLYPTMWVYLVQALAKAQQARTAPPQRRPALLAEMDECRDWLARRAADAPESFGHLVLFVDAERAWAIDDFRTAATTYDASLHDVESRHRPWHRALIAERAAQFHFSQGMQRAGRRLLSDARHHYEAWGATGKVRQLDHTYPFLRDSDRGTANGTDHGRRRRAHDYSSGSIRSDDVDMLAILRASQALSSETNLDRLYVDIVDHMRAITGAETVQLLVRDDTNTWILPTAATSHHNPITLDQAIAQNLLPATAFRYAERTREPLLVEDATRDDRFAKDPYLSNADRCSLLAVPILNHGDLRSVLLLENRLSSGAFSTDRLDAVILIAGQLAVSVDNALLYRRLEDKVTERTQELQAVNAQLETLTITDPLTTLANRRGFDHALADNWRKARAAGTPIAVAMIDIDYFKRYNDHYGHPAGDTCLQHVAHALISSTRSTDVVCRYGGEEFATIFPGADTDHAAAAAECARAAVANLAIPHTSTAAGIVTLSIGVAGTIPTSDTTPDALIATADTALYRAKEDGRNRVWTTSGPFHR